MRRPILALALAAVLVVAAPAALAHEDLPAEGANRTGHDHPTADDHSDNMHIVGNLGLGTREFQYGTDLAFWGSTAIVGRYGGPGGFNVVDIANAKRPRLIGSFSCPGPQGDVSIWDDLVFVSVDTPQQGKEGSSSDSCDVSGQTASSSSTWEGIRVVDISDPSEPQQIAAVGTDCGSHTHTLVPDLANERLLVYVLSYPLGGQGPACNVASHRKISVVEVPLADPAAARVVSTPSVNPAVGCHDVTVFLPESLAAAACITETQIWDISDPASPQVVSHIRDPRINIHHSSAFSNDGDTLIIGDELGGAAFSKGCETDGQVPLGALWFYDIAEPAAPVQKGSFVAPRDPAATCTAHNFNVVPGIDADVLVSAWYNAGVTVVDFTDASAPAEIAYYRAGKTEKAPEGNVWSAYWYRGYVWASNFNEALGTSDSSTSQSRGLDVLAVSHPSLKGAQRLPYLNPQTQEVEEPTPTGRKKVR